jgi:hypothetical protein
MEINKCSECESEYYRQTSNMKSLCPECSFYLYHYKNCNHQFEKGRFVKCYWDGSHSEYIKKCIIQNENSNFSKD